MGVHRRGSPATGTTVVYATHTSPRRSATPTACSCWPTASALFWGAPAELRAGRGAAGRRPRVGVRRASCTQRGPLSRALAARQGPADPARARRCWWRCSSSTRCVVALLIGLALSPRARQAEGRVRERGAGAASTSRSAASRFDFAIDGAATCSSTSSRSRSPRARGGDRKVRDGDVLAALIVSRRTPPQKLESALEPPQLEVLSTRRTRSRRASWTTRSTPPLPTPTGAVPRASRQEVARAT